MLKLALSRFAQFKPPVLPNRHKITDRARPEDIDE
jgi:hypothetical protein